VLIPCFATRTQRVAFFMQGNAENADKVFQKMKKGENKSCNRVGERL